MKLYDNLKHRVRYWLLRTLPTCRQTVQKISESMEHPLPLQDRFKVKLHLWICAWCQWYLEHLQLIRTATRAKGNEILTPDVTLSDEARERIRRKLTNPN